ncbi:MAG TPA: glycosyltransferase family A protein [Azoarcus taiwanensis]|nr:glycosyltransferase family A protein [Azoarcus taiwanensis]
MSGDRALVSASGFFDGAWYRKTYQAAENNKHDAAADYLRHAVSLGHDPGPDFSSEWYLQTYPDVAAAGMNPLVHFLRHGFAEGRLPKPYRAHALEVKLLGSDDRAADELERLMSDSGAVPAERCLAAWALARWWASEGRSADVLTALDMFEEVAMSAGADTFVPQRPALAPVLLRFSALCALGRRDDAATLLDITVARHGECPDLLLARVNWLRLFRPERFNEVLHYLDRLYRFPAQASSVHLSLRDSGQLLGLDNLHGQVGTASISLFRKLTARLAGRAATPTVSVIIPAYNAGATIATALRALWNQSWPALEVIVVDDASTDDTAAVVQTVVEAWQRASREGRSLRLITHARNQGAYAARNSGLAAAAGAFITTHDADDWSHPLKIALQVQTLLRDRGCQASVSHWVRCSAELVFGRWRVDDGWTYPNVSSLMFRRSVFERLGFWDRVSVGADTEYYYRILRCYGQAAITEVQPGVPLTFGRIDPRSLTQRSETHLRTQFGGVRRDYEDAFRRWHAAAADDELYVTERPEERPFAAPPGICR